MSMTDDDLRDLTERQVRDLRRLSRLMYLALGVLGVSILFNVSQGQKLTQVDNQLRQLQSALPVMADRKLQELMPQLELRARQIEESANRADQAMKGLDAKMLAAADSITARMESRLPGLLDRYIASKVDPALPRLRRD
jgi:hypothetical protein